MLKLLSGIIIGLLLPTIALAECGIASTYSSGSITANGEQYNHMAVSAAHKTLPFGTRVIVRNNRNGKSIVVRINDRGPFINGRIIDLSTGAKNALNMGGLTHVCLEVINYGRIKHVNNLNLIKGNHVTYAIDNMRINFSAKHKLNFVRSIIYPKAYFEFPFFAEFNPQYIKYKHHRRQHRQHKNYR
jgi:rare lipoprotein A (peptidoglycan hydrolase)